MSAPQWVTEPIGLVLVAVITGITAWVTTRATNRSTTRVTTQTVAGQIESSRLQAEENAYLRAEATLGRTIDRQDAEIRELEADIAGLRRRVAQQEIELAQCRSACRALARRMGGTDDTFPGEIGGQQ